MPHARVDLPPGTRANATTQSGDKPKPANTNKHTKEEPGKQTNKQTNKQANELTQERANKQMEK